jgi:hypothetical protein
MLGNTQMARETGVSPAGVVAAAEPLAPSVAATALIGTRIELGAAAAGFSAGFEAPTPFALVERNLLVTVVRPALEFEPVRLLSAAVQEPRGIELIAMEIGQLGPVRFDLATRNDPAALELLQRTLRSPVFSDQLDRMRAGVEQDLRLDKSVTISVAGVSLGLSVVYVFWLIRGGVLMGSYLSALPAWRVLDPLPVLSRVDEETQDDDEALAAEPRAGGNPLRGFA